MLYVDVKRRPELIYNNRYQKSRPYRTDGSDWNPAFTAMLRNVLFNQARLFAFRCRRLRDRSRVKFVTIPVGFLLLQWMSDRVNALDVLPWQMGIAVNRTLPTLTQVLVKSIASSVLLETFFYYSHRMMHMPLFYARVHKLHHQYK
jgi:sterol desaturase/sphingolipid hydroxylase (fatty acid hydroxylase superfamily)